MGLIAVVLIVLILVIFFGWWFKAYFWRLQGRDMWLSLKGKFSKNKGDDKLIEDDDLKEEGEEGEEEEDG